MIGCACVQPPAGPPQKPHSAETQAETEPSLSSVELRSHGPTVTVPASVWLSVNVSATGSLSSSPFSSFGAELVIFGFGEPVCFH